jgi:hypothetical protein
MQIYLVLGALTGISGPGMGRECKGSTFPAQSDVSDQIAGKAAGPPNVPRASTSRGLSIRPVAHALPVRA